MLYDVKAGIIGLSGIGKQYAHLLKYHVKNLDLIAASGRTQKELLHAKNDLSLQYVYSDFKQLIENHDIDAVFIFCPPDQKAHYATSAINAGKHVFIGLPMATNVEDARFLLKTAESRPSQTSMSGFAFRLDPRLLDLKSKLIEGHIGAINSLKIDSSFTHSLNSKYVKSSGSTFIDNVINEIDICLWLLDGEPESIQCQTKDLEFQVHGKMKNGVLFNISVRPSKTKNKGFLKVSGSTGRLHLDNESELIIRDIRKDSSSQQLHFIDPDFSFNVDYHHCKHFVDVIMGNSKSLLSLSSNVDAIQLAIAIEKSKVLNQMVLFEDQN